MPSVLIVDDQAEFRRLARDLLEADGFEVIGEASDGEEGLRVAQALHPEIVLLDVQMPGLDGFSTAARLAHFRNPPAVILVSSRRAADYGERVAHSGARGFIAKNDLSGGAVTALLA